MFQKPGSGLGSAHQRKVEASLRDQSPLRRAADALSPAAKEALAVRDERRRQKANEAARRRHEANLAMLEKIARSGNANKPV